MHDAVAEPRGPSLATLVRGRALAPAAFVELFRMLRVAVAPEADAVLGGVRHARAGAATRTLDARGAVGAPRRVVELGVGPRSGCRKVADGAGTLVDGGPEEIEVVAMAVGGTGRARLETVAVGVLVAAARQALDVVRRGAPGRAVDARALASLGARRAQLAPPVDEGVAVVGAGRREDGDGERVVVDALAGGDVDGDEAEVAELDEREVDRHVDDAVRNRGRVGPDDDAVVVPNEARLEGGGALGGDFVEVVAERDGHGAASQTRVRGDDVDEAREPRRDFAAVERRHPRQAEWPRDVAERVGDAAVVGAAAEVVPGGLVERLGRVEGPSRGPVDEDVVYRDEFNGVLRPPVELVAAADAAKVGFEEFRAEPRAVEEHVVDRRARVEHAAHRLRVDPDGVVVAPIDLGGARRVARDAVAADAGVVGRERRRRRERGTRPLVSRGVVEVEDPGALVQTREEVQAGVGFTVVPRRVVDVVPKEVVRQIRHDLRLRRLARDRASRVDVEHSRRDVVRRRRPFEPDHDAVPLLPEARLERVHD
mmetsp:Transcript_2195/g.6729  ORF Transcript_2195/g.6729 Transcript_2195/m.6729 type:complete len:540 (+) Transcript_2195:496-2115(+)